MDTNLITALITALANKTAPVAPQLSSAYLVAGLIIAAIVPTLAAAAGWLQAKSAAVNAAAAKDKAIETASEAKAAALAATASIDKIHTAVNSERSSMMDELRKAREEIRQLASELSTMKERSRGDQSTAPLITELIAALKGAAQLKS